MTVVDGMDGIKPEMSPTRGSSGHQAIGDNDEAVSVLVSSSISLMESIRIGEHIPCTRLR